MSSNLDHVQCVMAGRSQSRRAFVRSSLVWVPTLFFAPSLLVKAQTAGVRFGMGASGNVFPSAVQPGTLVSSYTVNNNNFGIGSSAGYMWGATKITAAYTCNVGNIQLQMRRFTNPPFGFKVGLYSSVADNPGSLIGSWSDTVLGSSLGAVSGAFYSPFPNFSSSIVAGSDYFIVVQCDNWNGSDYVIWHTMNGVNTTRGHLVDADGTGTWSQYSATTGCGHKLYAI